MADTKISALTAATTPLDGTEVLPIVQSSTTKKVANNDLRPKQIQSNATSGVLQVAGPAAATTRVMTVPNANFTAARTDASQTFTGDQTFADLIGTNNYAAGAWRAGTNTIGGTNSGGAVAGFVSNTATKIYTEYVYNGTGGTNAGNIGNGTALFSGQSGGNTDFGVYSSGTLFLGGNTGGAVKLFSNASAQIGLTLDTSNNVTVGYGNLVIGTSGKGIDFSATSSGTGTMTSELFADYEEGTFTPTAVGSTTAGTGTYSEQTGVYTKIGRAVYVFIAINWSAHTGTGNLRIAGLPFSAAKNDVASMFANGLTYTGTHLQPFCVGTEIWLNQTSSNTGDSYIPMDTNCQLAFSVVYYV